MTSKGVHETFSKDLADPEFMAKYLEECLADGPEIFFTGLGDLARANGMTNVGDNPEFRAVDRVLDALGLELTVNVKVKVA